MINQRRNQRNDFCKRLQMTRSNYDARCSRSVTIVSNVVCWLPSTDQRTAQEGGLVRRLYSLFGQRAHPSVQATRKETHQANTKRRSRRTSGRSRPFCACDSCLRVAPSVTVRLWTTHLPCRVVFALLSSFGCQPVTLPGLEIPFSRNGHQSRWPLRESSRERERPNKTRPT